MNKYQCPKCSGIVEGDGSFVTKPCSDCGWSGSRRPRQYRYTGRTTEFRNSQELANRMRDNGAPDWEIEYTTGVRNPYK